MWRPDNKPSRVRSESGYSEHALFWLKPESRTFAATNQRQTQAIIRDGSTKRILLGLIRNLRRPQRIPGSRPSRRRTQETDRRHLARILPPTSWVCRGLDADNYTSQGVGSLRSC